MFRPTNVHINITLDLSISDKKEIDTLISSRAGAQPITPELVDEKNVRSPKDYNRFRDLDIKNQFRMKLINELNNSLKRIYGNVKAENMIKEFKKLSQSLEENGAFIIGSMIHPGNFQKLIDHYTHSLSTTGSKSWIHSYVNLGNHPEFLNNKDFNGAFMHPLLIALISYAAGGPIRIVDARGKDAEPLAVQAQDNMLHIDNTPFRKEFKIILTWERGKPSGPKGQNFVFIPGTHKGVRNCNVSATGKAWSTEDGSIFTSVDSVQKIFDMQKKFLPGKPPTVVEATHPTMPLTTVFEAGALVHHRYRTKEKNVDRSCVIIAFHRALDNPGQFLSEDMLNQIAPKGSLINLLMGKHTHNTEKSFIDAILLTSKLIAEKIDEINSAPLDNVHTQIVPFTTRNLDEKELQKWKNTVTSAPTVETIKIERAYFNIGDNLSKPLLIEMMKYDKHGPLDLILYGDGHEEIRKWARNRIREMPIPRLENRVNKLIEYGLIHQPDKKDLLTPAELKKVTDKLIKYIDDNDKKIEIHLDAQEKIPPHDALRSIRQLLEDLGEAILRCASRQTFLSTSLFILWACDELGCLIAGKEKKPPQEILDSTNLLLANYISTYVLIEKQIKMEKTLSSVVTPPKK